MIKPSPAGSATYKLPCHTSAGQQWPIQLFLAASLVTQVHYDTWQLHRSYYFTFFFLQTSLLFFWAIPRHACSCWMCFSVLVLNFLFIFNLLIERQMLLFWFVLSTSGDESPDKDSDEAISISSYWRFTASEPYTTCKICTQKTHHHAHTPN